MVFSDKMRLSCDWCWLYVLIISRTRFRVDSHSSCLNVKQLLAWNRREIRSLSDWNWTQTHNHLVHKRTLNYLAKLTKWPAWLNVRVFVYELSGFGFESSCSNCEWYYQYEFRYSTTEETSFAQMHEKQQIFH